MLIQLTYHSCTWNLCIHSPEGCLTWTFAPAIFLGALAFWQSVPQRMETTIKKGQNDRGNTWTDLGDGLAEGGAYEYDNIDGSRFK